MYNPDLLYVEANLEEDRLPGVEPGNPVHIKLDAFAEPFRGRVVWVNKSTGAQFALMPRNVVSGEFTHVVQRVPVRIQIERDDRWPRLRAGLSATVAIAHGPGDAAWAAEAARAMEELETRYNARETTERAGRAVGTAAPSAAGGDTMTTLAAPARSQDRTRSAVARARAASTGWPPWRCSSSSSRPTRRWSRRSSPTTQSAWASRRTATT